VHFRRRDEFFLLSKALPQNASREEDDRRLRGSLARLNTDRLNDCFWSFADIARRSDEGRYNEITLVSPNRAAMAVSVAFVLHDLIKEN
jgi:diketogulonate reductase-like aldo/keto reductase